MNRIVKPLLTAIFTIAVVTSIFAQSKTGNMKLTPPQTAPVFTVKDVNGNNVTLTDFKGKKIMLTFHRNAGCPICNLRFHELERQAGYFKSKGLVMLAVYESSAENLKNYLDGANPYATMIPNLDLSLYELYHIERSTGKLIKGMFHGALGQIKKGNKLFTKKMKQDGTTNRITADFLIDENGKIVTAYYGKYVGDNLPLADIKKFID